MKIAHSIVIIFSLLVIACGSSDSKNTSDPSVASDLSVASDSRVATAAITAVIPSGEPGQYFFTVTIESPDTGCEQYADWWEVVKVSDGSLVYRRILTHSHVNEQPFTRIGGLVPVTANEEVVVRAHMNNSGYGEIVFKGSIEQGLIQATADSDFFEALEFEDPLPDGCTF